MPHYLGVDIGGTNVKIALVAESGETVFVDSRPWSGGAPEEAVGLVSAELAVYAARTNGSAPIACGAGCAGLIDRSNGIVRSAPNLVSWVDVPLSDALAGATGLRVVVDNDANTAAYAEYHLGAARGARNAVVVTLGTGIGGGLILEGRVYRGSNGFAAEIGHMTVDAEGPPCRCGGRGCLETMANAAALVTRAAALVEADPDSSLAPLLAGGRLESRDVGEAAGAGDRAALAAVREVGTSLGVGLANIVELLDPDIIVVAGGVSLVGEPLLEAARREMGVRAARWGSRLPRVALAQLGETAGVVGAALLARDELGGT